MKALHAPRPPFAGTSSDLPSQIYGMFLHVHDRLRDLAYPKSLSSLAAA